MVVVRDRFRTEIREAGEPVIHELIHGLNKELRSTHDAGHLDAKLWRSASRGAECVQALAQEYYHRVAPGALDRSYPGSGG